MVISIPNYSAVRHSQSPEGEGVWSWLRKAVPSWTFHRLRCEVIACWWYGAQDKPSYWVLTCTPNCSQRQHIILVLKLHIWMYSCIISCEGTVSNARMITNLCIPFDASVYLFFLKQKPAAAFDRLVFNSSRRRLLIICTKMWYWVASFWLLPIHICWLYCFDFFSSHRSVRRVLEGLHGLQMWIFWIHASHWTFSILRVCKVLTVSDSSE